MAEVQQLPGDRQAVGVHRTGSDRVRLHDGKGVAQADPAAIGAVDVTAHPAGEQVHPGRAVGLEVNPADVRPIGEAAQVAQAVLVHPEVIGREVLVIDAVRGAAVAQVNPAHVGGVYIPGTNVFADDCAMVGVAAPVHPAEVRAPGVFIGGVNRRGGVCGS